MEKRFNFYNNIVIAKSENIHIIDLLSKNFSFFEVESKRADSVRTQLSLNLQIVDKIPYERIPSLISSKQTRNAVVYENENIKYCDYYQQGLVIFNKTLNSAEIFCLNIGFLHELSYLFILSRVGKEMDFQGLHKIHACAFKKNNKSVVCMMPMKGGKSTLFLKMINDLEVKIFSDDCPIISSDGSIYPFPLRVGIKELPENINNIEEYIFELERKEFGNKKLIDIRAFKNKIAQASNANIILIDAVRTTYEQGRLEPISKLKMLFPLLKYMGIGLGLPIIIEYFLENGFKGFFQNCLIFSKRIFAIINLLFKSKQYRLYMGTNKDDNIRLVQNLLV